MKPGKREPGREQLVAAASRFNAAQHPPRGPNKPGAKSPAGAKPADASRKPTTNGRKPAGKHETKAILHDEKLDVRDSLTAELDFGVPAGRAQDLEGVTLSKATIDTTASRPTTAPKITPTTAKPPAIEVDERVAAILRDAARRTAAGSQDAILSSISDERIIGRGDLQDLSYLEVGIAVARGVARIRVPGASGSASLVGPRILMTNQHVIPDRATAAGAFAQFDLQDDSDGRALPRHDYALDPGFFFFTDEALDVTLVGIAERSQAGRPAAWYPWTRVTNGDLELRNDDALTIIQHPLGGMKQIAFRNNDVVEVQQTEGVKHFIYYTTDTQQGSSGSPCFDDLWRLVALHHQGVPATNAQGEILTRDGKAFRKGVDRADTILWVANEGVRGSAILDAIRAAKLGDEHAYRRDAMLGEPPPNPVALARETTGTAARPNRQLTTSNLRKDRKGAAMNGTGGLSVVIQISGDEIRGIHIERDDGHDVQLPTSNGAPPYGVPLPGGGNGQSRPALTGVTQGDEDPDSDEAIKIDPDWKARKGYDAAFLGDIRVPLPKLGKEQEKITLKVPDGYLREGGDPIVFDYHHYSLAFNKKRRIAWYSAANVDGDQREFKYKRGKDRWFYDPRMDDADSAVNQIGEELYSAADTDRGHLTRYLDVQWGATLEETRNATNDTFHFSNCALQLSGFNQGKDRWQGIEQFLLEKKARKEKRRLIVMTGPVLKPTDPVYRTAGMTQGVRVPLAFWKLCALVPQDDRPLAVTAFVLGQPDAADLPDMEEKFDVAAVQVTVDKLQTLTGFKFSKTLLDNDHFAKQGAGSLERYAILEDETDIVV